MLKVIARLLMIIIILGSCHSENEVQGTECHIVSDGFQRFTSPEASYTTNYSFDKGILAQLKVKEVNPNVTYEYITNLTYSQDGTISQIEQDDNRFSYTSSEGRVSKVDYFYQNKLQSSAEFEYSTNGLINKQQTRLGNGDKYGYIDYSYNSDDQLIREEHFSQGGVLGQTIEYEYDSKKNPYFEFPAFLTKSDILIGFPRNGKNNIVKVTDTNGTNTEVTSYVYKYNDKDYPISYTATRGTKSTTGTFEYDCSQ